ncbi:class I SAM-dependent methyltransferase [bacterium]|nr:class I SAM-dependent methyltransferase [bacterium]MCK4598060.1 class I SAM-dependent methyltransferase [bacterium]
MRTERVKCPLCGQHTKEAVLWIKNAYRYVQCTVCGMIYINPQLSDESVAQIYSNVLYGQKSERLDLVLPTLHKYKARLLKKFERFRKTGYLLDVGCFKGFLLFSASQRGWKTFGTEVSEPATRFAREELEQQVDIGDLLHMSRFDQLDFDVVTLFDVIEHLSRPCLYLQKVHYLLRKGGLLYMETPNFNALPRFVLGKKWTVFNSLHRSYFTPSTMARMLQRVGFESIKIQTLGFLPLSTRENEPESSKVKPEPKFLRFLPIDLLRNTKDIVESAVFFPPDFLGIKVGTKMVVRATKGA